MINLLPTDKKDIIRYAKRNRLLLNWIVIVSLCFIGLYAIIGIGYIYLNSTTIALQKEVAQQAEELESPAVKSAKEELQSIQANTQLAVDVLTRQILFSELITDLSAILPEQVVLNNLALSNDASALDLTFNTATLSAGSQTLANLRDPNNGVFVDADLNSLTCSDEPSPYPCTASIKALLADTAQFRLKLDTAEEEANNE